ncbi:MAG: ABC transporter permease, partial [Bacteroidales bacterium]|nr:ABC transporter permease [Bacteroidales bacterium]
MRDFKFRNIKTALSQMLMITWNEIRCIFKDSGVLLILIIAGIGYPLLYSVVYLGESVDQIPVGIVDECGDSQSRSFTRKLDATREIELVDCVNMDEAIQMMKGRRIHGIVVIPKDFTQRIGSGRQTTVSLYINMATFFIYKNIALACNYVMLDEGKNIAIQRCSAQGLTEHESLVAVEPVP